jgi:hypothetical protein
MHIRFLRAQLGRVARASAPPTVSHRLARAARDGVGERALGKRIAFFVCGRAEDGRLLYKGHLDYLEWLGPSLEEAEKEAQETGWLGTHDVRRALAAETAKRMRGRTRSH